METLIPRFSGNAPPCAKINKLPLIDRPHSTMSSFPLLSTHISLQKFIFFSQPRVFLFYLTPLGKLGVTASEQTGSLKHLLILLTLQIRLSVWSPGRWLLAGIAFLEGKTCSGSEVSHSSGKGQEKLKEPDCGDVSFKARIWLKTECLAGWFNSVHCTFVICSLRKCVNSISFRL